MASVTDTIPAWANATESDLEEGIFARTIGGNDDFGVQIVQNDDEKPFLRLWAGNFIDLPIEQDLFSAAEAFQDAAVNYAIQVQGAQVIEWRFADKVETVYIFDRVVEGVGPERCTIPARVEGALADPSPAAERFAQMRPGETSETDYKFDRVWEKHTDTLIGEFELVKRLDGWRAVVRPVTAAA